MGGQVATNTVLSLPGKISSVGLSLPGTLSFDDWLSVGEELKRAEQSLMWWIGDWLRFGEITYGETYSQAADATDQSIESIRAAKWVSERFETVRRRTDLSWSHHKEVAALAPNDADRFLALASEQGWSRNELRKHVSQAKAAAALLGYSQPGNTCTVQDLWDLVEQGVKFGTVYADPPWRYDNQGTRAATGNHYDGMSVDEICALPVKDLVAPSAHLHLWITNGFLFDAPRIFDAWGFEFRSSFAWVKPQIGIGNYWRNSHEFLLTAIRGDAKRFADKSLKSWLECDRGPHSQKPEQVRSFIGRASPGPFLELFGRRAVDGWAVWGNQIERDIFHASLKEVA